jgi:predicted MFS family arabinose efflux permease
MAEHPLYVSADFRNLFIGDVLVTVAERYFVLTFTWWLIAGPHADKSRLAVLLTFESLPILGVGILVGPIIDRLNKKWCMFAVALVQALLVAGVASLLFFDELSFVRLCIAGLFLGCMIPLFEGAANAGLPQSVQDRHMLAAAALQSSTLEFSNIIAAALSATLLSAFGFKTAVIVDASLYLVGALFLLRLRGAAFGGAPGEGSYFGDLRAGLSYILERPQVWSFVGVYVAKLVMLVPLLILIPMLVESVLGRAVRWVAVLETAFSLGAIVTAFFFSLNATHRRLYRGYAAALAVLGVLMLVLTRWSNPYVMIPHVALMGACVAVLLALSNMFFHHAVPDDMKGRFFGILETLAAAATPLGYSAVGFLTMFGRVQGVLIASGAGLFLLAILVLFLPRNDDVVPESTW